MLTCRWNSFTGNYNKKIQLEDNKIVRKTGKDLQLQDYKPVHGTGTEVTRGNYNYRITNLFMEQVRR